MEYSEKDFLRDYAERTIKNLNKIEQCVKNGEDFFEVTQLVNSFMGLIILPQVYLDELIEDNYLDVNVFNGIKQSIILNTYSNKRKDITLRNILYHMRNAVAHGNLKFDSQQNQNGMTEIAKIEFTDKWGKMEFIIKLDVEIIKVFLLDFSDKLLGV